MKPALSTTPLPARLAPPPQLAAPPVRLPALQAPARLAPRHPPHLAPQHAQQLDSIVRRLHATLASLAGAAPANGAARSALCAHLASQAATLDAGWNAHAAGTRAQARLAARTREHLRALAEPGGAPADAAAPAGDALLELRRTEAELRRLLRDAGALPGAPEPV